MSWPGQLDPAYFPALAYLSDTALVSSHPVRLMTDICVGSLAAAGQCATLGIRVEHGPQWHPHNVIKNNKYQLFLCISVLHIKCSSLFVFSLMIVNRYPNCLTLHWTEIRKFSPGLFVMTLIWSVMFYFNKTCNGQFCYRSNSYRIDLNMMVNII